MARQCFQWWMAQHRASNPWGIDLEAFQALPSVLVCFCSFPFWDISELYHWHSCHHVRRKDSMGYIWHLGYGCLLGIWRLIGLELFLNLSPQNGLTGEMKSRGVFRHVVSVQLPYRYDYNKDWTARGLALQMTKGIQIADFCNICLETLSQCIWRIICIMMHHKLCLVKNFDYWYDMLSFR